MTMDIDINTCNNQENKNRNQLTQFKLAGVGWLGNHLCLVRLLGATKLGVAGGGTLLLLRTRRGGVSTFDELQELVDAARVET